MKNSAVLYKTDAQRFDRNISGGAIFLLTAGEKYIFFRSETSERLTQATSHFLNPFVSENNNTDNS